MAKSLSTYQATIGATEWVDIVCDFGTPTGLETVTARLKPLDLIRRNAAIAGSEVVANFTTQFFAASGNSPAYWRLTLSAEITDTIAPGLYIVKAKIVLGDGLILKPVPIIFEFSE